MYVGKRLRELRERTGYSVNLLADFSGISQSHLRRVEAGIADITVGHLALICDALGITLRDFFNVSDDPDDLSAIISNLSAKQRQLLIEFLKSL